MRQHVALGRKPGGRGDQRDHRAERGHLARIPRDHSVRPFQVNRSPCKTPVGVVGDAFGAPVRRRLLAGKRRTSVLLVTDRFFPAYSPD